MQVVNDTDETITLEPGEAVSVFKTTTHQFEGTSYRVTLDSGVDGPKDVSELMGVRDFVEQKPSRVVD